MIEKIPFTTTKAEYQGKSFNVQEHASPYDIQEKVNEIIDWINDVCALNVTDKQVTANMPNIDAGELAYLQKENSDLKDEIDRTRKALDVAVDALKSAHDYYEYCIQRDKDCDSDDINWDCTAMNMDNDISEALEQITALEQKDK